MAVAHTILVIIYHNILKDGTTYKELGGNYFDERDKEAIARRLASRLEKLGYEVEMRKAA